MTDATGAARPGSLRVAFRTLGCKVNQVESERIAAELLGMGVVLAEEDSASVVVVNSCTVTAEADAKVRKAVRHALQAESGPVVVVTGCLANLDPAALRALGERVVVESDKEAVAARVGELLGIRLPTPAAPGAPAAAARKQVFHTRAMVKVEEGCDARCAYCIVPDARGRPRSEPLESIVAEATALHAAGVAEVVLTGTNIGRFDGDGGLPALLHAVASTGIPRIRLSSIEPLDVDDAFLHAAAGIPAFVRHLHVPLQSGSDAVLAVMGRGYDAATYLARIEAAREALPGLALTTDVLAGFPGESPEDTASTLALCERAAFQRLHVFRYSARPGTPAATFAGQVPPRQIAERAAALRALSGRLFERYLERRLGGRAAVLVERVESGHAEGVSEDYLRVRFSLEGVSVGAVVDVTLTGVEGAIVLGRSEGRQ